jgi:hypothetical protein
VLLPPKEDLGIFFHSCWAPARNTVLRLYRKLEEEGSVKEGKRPRAPALGSPENVEALRTHFVPQLLATQLPIGTQVPRNTMLVSCWIF